MKESTLLHNISPEDFFSRLKEIVAEFMISNSPPIQKENIDENLTVEETALYFKKSKDTIENWTQKGFLIKYGGIGTSVYYKRSEIEKVLVPLKVNKY